MNQQVRYYLSFVIVFTLLGCATTTLYYNPSITDSTALNRQFAIDDGYCIAAASGAVPIPPIRIYSTGQKSYTINGTATSYNPYSGYTRYKYSGRANVVPSPGSAFATGFANGFANGASIGAAFAAKQAQKRIYHGCMTAFGWTTHK